MYISTKMKRGKRGMTLIELLIALSVLTIIMVGITQSGASVTRLFATSVSRVSIEQQLRQSIGKLNADLRLAAQGSFDALGAAPLWTNATGFDRIEGFDAINGAGEWGTMRVELRMGTGETDDGTDEDGDGLVDERQLVLIRDFGGAAQIDQVILRGVPELYPGELPNGLDDNGNGLLDETGFALYSENGALKVLLAKSGIDPEGRMITRFLETSMKLRN